MIAENPFWGTGKGSFVGNYMHYQADYFERYPDSKYVLLADNVTHPFNEYLSFTIEYGLFALLFIAGIIFILLKFAPSNYSPSLGVVLGIMIFSCFSYPFRYPILLLILSYSLAELSRTVPAFAPVKILHNGILKGVLGILFMIGIYLTIIDIRFELQWKELISLCSLGKREEVIENYKKLYLKWNGNPYFLYNYAAELNRLRCYEESNNILHKCEEYFTDYDVQLLFAENYSNLDKKKTAVEYYESALNMCPNRFIPLYQLMKIYKEDQQSEKIKIIAQ